MVQRKRLGLIFSYNEQWIGGTYYTINLINALGGLAESEQPEIVIFSDAVDFERLKIEISYQFLKFEELNHEKLTFWQRGINYFSSNLISKKLYTPTYKGKLDALFLFQHCGYLDSVHIKKRIYWIPDFQDKYLPNLFTEEKLQKKDEKCRWIANNASNLILSSEAAYKDWMEFYPFHKCQVNVLHFAVTHPVYEHIDISMLKAKYQLPYVYFFAPNQFWAHKNHIVAIKAAEVLKKRGKPVVIVFSGKENDSRNPDYIEYIKKYVADHDLYDVVKFLGFIDRAEQLKIMKNARAVIQPSRFEGWSTVIEDAMAMRQQIIASDLEVHKEQLGENGFFFSTDNHESLAEIILQLQESESFPIDYSYDTKKLTFASKFIKLIS
jgi:glycosyltransferase involved in cell wall biosynthesis